MARQQSVTNGCCGLCAGEDDALSSCAVPSERVLEAILLARQRKRRFDQRRLRESAKIAKDEKAAFKSANGRSASEHDEAGRQTREIYDGQRSVLQEKIDIHEARVSDLKLNAMEQAVTINEQEGVDVVKDILTYYPPGVAKAVGNHFRQQPAINSVDDAIAFVDAQLKEHVPQYLIEDTKARLSDSYCRRWHFL